MSEYLKLGIGRNKKLNILTLIILALVVRLFFFVAFGEKVLAKKQENNFQNKQIVIDPLKNIDRENFFGERDNDNVCDRFDYKKGDKIKDSQEMLYADIVKDHPMQEMATDLAKKDKKVAAFLIAIAKKESNWGKHSPKKNGKECYNYWGYRGSYNATDSGYSCFDSPAQAISVVGGRIEDLINQQIDTPEKMVVWKCGRSCSWDNPTAVRKWISDVSLYYNKVNS
jgi:hypothetical protein